MIFLPILVLHFLILSKLTFTAWPEMLSYSYLLSHGFTLYKDLVAPYTPGLIFLQTLFFNLFGFTPETLKVLAWLLIFISDLLMFLLLRKVTKSNLISGIFLTIFVLLQSFFDGNMLWFDFASVIPLLAALLFIFKYLEGKVNNLFWVGFFLGLAFMTKQIALIYLPVFLISYLFINRKLVLRQIGLVLAGFSITTFPFVIYLILQNTLIDFLLWSVYYPSTFWSHFPGYVDLNTTNYRIKIISLLLLPLVFGLFNFKKLINNKNLIFIVIFFLVSIIAIFPRFSYFHLQPPIAFLVLLIAGIFTELSSRIKKVDLVLLAITLGLLINYLAPTQLGNNIRFYSQTDKVLAGKIKDVASEDPIWLINLSSAFYVYSGLLPSKPWVDNFGWYMEIPGVQDNILKGFDQNPPKFIFWQQPTSGNWFDIGTYQPSKIVLYIKNHYQKVDNINSVEIWKIKN